MNNEEMKDEVTIKDLALDEICEMLTWHRKQIVELEAELAARLYIELTGEKSDML